MTDDERKAGIARRGARSHTCINTATTTDGSVLPPCLACYDTFDRALRQGAYDRAVATGRQPPNPRPSEGVFHLTSRMPFRPVCGADQPNQNTTWREDLVTCRDCLAANKADSVCEVPEGCIISVHRGRCSRGTEQCCVPHSKEGPRPSEAPKRPAACDCDGFETYTHYPYCSYIKDAQTDAQRAFREKHVDPRPNEPVPDEDGSNIGPHMLRRMQPRPAFVPGMLVEYQPSLAQGRWYSAVVDELPRKLGSSTVVRLREVHPGQGRTTIAAASIDCVRPSRTPKCPRCGSLTCPAAKDWGEYRPSDDKRMTTMSKPLTFGELKIGEFFIGFPKDGDDSGHGGYRKGSYVFQKIAEGYTPGVDPCTDNSQRLIDNSKSSMPNGMLVLKVLL